MVVRAQVTSGQGFAVRGTRGISVTYSFSVILGFLLLMFFSV